jgi:mRNA interferase MazF
MPSTTNYKRGDVVLVPFPFTDLSSNKQRPALVVSSDAFNSTHSDIVVVAITSHVPVSMGPDEFFISQDELRHCGLPKPSILKLSKIVTLHQRLTIKRIGSMSQPSLEKVLQQIRAQFLT